MRRPKFSSKYLIQHISTKLIPAVKVCVCGVGGGRPCGWCCWLSSSCRSHCLPGLVVAFRSLAPTCLRQGLSALWEPPCLAAPLAPCVCAGVGEELPAARDPLGPRAQRRRWHCARLRAAQRAGEAPLSALSSALSSAQRSAQRSVQLGTDSVCVAVGRHPDVPPPAGRRAGLLRQRRQGHGAQPAARPRGRGGVR